MAISTDIGGTFTDLAAYDLSTGTIHQVKDYTDPADLASGTARCIDKSGLTLVRRRSSCTARPSRSTPRSSGPAQPRRPTSARRVAGVLLLAGRSLRNSGVAS
jgi:hypothetical protein